MSYTRYTIAYQFCTRIYYIKYVYFFHNTIIDRGYNNGTIKIIVRLYLIF